MKTTIDIPDDLMRKLKSLARKRGVTLRAVVEQAFREVLRSASAQKPFQLRDRSFRGEGLVSDEGWSRIRDEIYKGRGS